MIGVALISAAAVFFSSFRDTFGRALDRAVTADYIVLDTDSFQPLSPEVAARLADLPELSAVSPLRSIRGDVAGQHRDVQRRRRAGLPRARRRRRHRRRLRRPRRRRRAGVPRDRRGRGLRRRRRDRGDVAERRRVDAHRVRHLRRQLAHGELADLDRHPRAGVDADAERLDRARQARRRRRLPGGDVRDASRDRGVPAGDRPDQRRVPRRSRRTRSTRSCSSSRCCCSSPSCSRSSASRSPSRSPCSSAPVRSVCSEPSA